MPSKGTKKATPKPKPMLIATPKQDIGYFVKQLDEVNEKLESFEKAGRIMTPKGFTAVTGRVERLIASVDRATGTSVKKEERIANQKATMLVRLNKVRAAEGLDALTELPK